MLSVPPSRWLTRVAVLAALAISLPGVRPAGAGPSAQLAGQEATVVADENLNVRAGPGLDQPVISRVPPGSVVTLVSGPLPGDGTWTWCEHTGWGGQGWSVCQALHTAQDVSAGVAAPPPVQSTAQGPTRP